MSVLRLGSIFCLVGESVRVTCLFGCVWLVLVFPWWFVVLISGLFDLVCTIVVRDQQWNRKW